MVDGHIKAMLNYNEIQNLSSLHNRFQWVLKLILKILHLRPLAIQSRTTEVLQIYRSNFTFRLMCFLRQAWACFSQQIWQACAPQFGHHRCLRRSSLHCQLLQLRCHLQHWTSGVSKSSIPPPADQHSPSNKFFPTKTVLFLNFLNLLTSTNFSNDFLNDVILQSETVFLAETSPYTTQTCTRLRQIAIMNNNKPCSFIIVNIFFAMVHAYCMLLPDFWHSDLHLACFYATLTTISHTLPVSWHALWLSAKFNTWHGRALISRASRMQSIFL